jgi:Flp pilus assembly protein CpaB
MYFMEAVKPKKEIKVSKNRKILIVFVLGILLAFATGVAVYQYLTPQRTTVYLFNQDYVAGTQVVMDMLVPIQMDNTVVISGMNISTGDILITNRFIQEALQTASVLRTDVSAGTPFMSSHLTATGGNSIEMRMRSDAVAVTLSVDNVTGITNELSFGSRVNVYASYNGETYLSEGMENLRVLRTTMGTNGLSTVTLEVDGPEALMLVHAAQYSILHLGLIDGHNYQYLDRELRVYNITGFVPHDSVSVHGDSPGGGTIIDASDPNNPIIITVGPDEEEVDD